MNIDITTPALLFPAISLLLLAYTSKFLTTGQLIRGLVRNANNNKGYEVVKQVENLKKRVNLIRWMQISGTLSLLLCVISMFFIFEQMQIIGNYVFALSLVCMAISLIITIYEVYISAYALGYELNGLENDK